MGMVLISPGISAPGELSSSARAESEKAEHFADEEAIQRGTDRRNA